MSQETPASKTEAQIKTKRRISPFWLLPLIALMIAGWLVWDSYQDRGNSVTIDFMSADGIVPGRTPVRYQGVEVGTVEDVSLSKDLRKIEVRVSIKSDMEDALREETQFWLVTPKASLAGVSGLDALVGGNYIGMMPGKGKPRDHFVALDTQPKYRLSNGDLMIHLHAPDLGSLNSGSLVYFRKIPVGRVYDYSINPNKQGVTIDVLIERRFTDLVKKGSRFWNVSGIDADLSLSGAKVQLNGSGLTVQASPLSRALKGAISFDNLSGASASRRKGDKRILYASETSARAVGGQITLHAFDAGKLAEGMPIRYLGIDIGQIQTLELITARNEVQAKAVLYPEYVQTFARAGTRFSVITPQISAAGVEHLDTILQPYINVEPGRGAARRDFELQEATITDSRYLDGLSIVVEAPEAGSLNIGTPVLFRGIEVGTVTGMSLGSLSDRVMITLRISKRYQYLVRNNSVFWLASGYSLDFGLTGGVVKTGTFNQFIRGGIAFATPPGTPLAPKAQAGKHFLLQESEPKEWREWGTALPR